MRDQEANLVLEPAQAVTALPSPAPMKDLDRPSPSSALGTHEEVERSRPETVALSDRYNRRTRKSSKEFREAVSDRG
jgi:hypothetical protein